MENKKIFFHSAVQTVVFIMVIFVFSPQTMIFFPGVLASDEAAEAPAGEESAAATIEENTAGEDGTDGGGEEVTIIETGDSSLAIEVENDVNQNDYGAVSVVEPEEENIVAGGADDAGEIDETFDTASSTAAAAGGASSTSIMNDNTSELANAVEGSGNTGGNVTEESGGDSIIDTGNVSIDSQAANNINNNTAQTACGDDCGDSGSPETITVDNDNTASTTNDVDLAANTGQNTIGTTSGAAVITTGDIDIFSAIINFINTNFFGFGRDFFINLFTRLAGEIDLSGYGAGPEEEGTAASGQASVCGPDCVINIDNSSTSTLLNKLDITADTGTNSIASAGGPALIQTGDINILNDIVNIANLNIAGSDWFFAIVNIFDVLEGDVILPSLFEGNDEEAVMAAEEAAKEKAQLIVANDNFADAVNNIDVIANTGMNTNSGNIGTTTIDTGDATVEVKQFNLVNYNFTGDGWRFIRVNLFGAWDGTIEGLPDGYDYIEDESGITIYNHLFIQDIFNDAFAKLAVANTNHASATNDITIDANTGENGILHGAGGGSVMTGDILIKNILLNFLNSNFTGNNWLFSMINIFGGWQGNLSFGRPELWIAESMSAPDPVSRGDYITYTFLFGNRGDAAATDVDITDDFDEKYVSVAEAAEGKNEGGKLSWEIGKLPPNSQGSISYTVRVRDDIPYGRGEIGNLAAIGSAEGDRDRSNNTAGGTVAVDGGQVSGGGGGFHAALSGGRDQSGSGGFPGLSIMKKNDADGEVAPGDRVNYQIIIKNTGSASLEDVLVADVMTDETGQEEINRDFWDLETLYAGEEVIIDYTMEIKPEIIGGVYTNEAIVEGYDVARGQYISAIASAKIKVDNSSAREMMPGPLLEADLISKPGLFHPGDTGEQEIIVTNNGGEPAVGVSITESLPHGLTFAGDSGSIKKWEIGVIAPGEFKNIYIDIKAGDGASAGVHTAALVIKAENHSPIVINRDLKVIGPESAPAAPAAIEDAEDGILADESPRVLAEGVFTEDNESAAAAMDRYFEAGDIMASDDGEMNITAPVSAGQIPKKSAEFKFAIDLFFALALLAFGFYAVSALRARTSRLMR